MTITVTVRSMANAKSLPMRTSQTKKVMRAAAQGNDGEPQRRGVGEVLGLRFAFLGLFDQIDDLRQKRILAGALDLDGQRTFTVDGPADDLAAASSW